MHFLRPGKNKKLYENVIKNRKRESKHQVSALKYWSEWGDLNPRPLGPEL